jgi:hypothetical protein
MLYRALGLIPCSRGAAAAAAFPVACFDMHVMMLFAASH